MDSSSEDEKRKNDRRGRKTKGCNCGHQHQNRSRQQAITQSQHEEKNYHRTERVPPDATQEKSATWRNKVPRNHAVGIACSEYHETGAACAVEVSIENNRPLLQELERLRHIQRRPYDSQKPDTI
ncbi:MAG: hypothetical protein DMG13_12945 [Acidobacteria bacterium]|nr:MAG: hypothetical protein DMG13_12945 [Acidobacteriota bacterium]